MRLTRISFKDITNLIQRYSLYQQSCLSIEQFTTFGEPFIFLCLSHAELYLVGTIYLCKAAYA